MRCLSILLAALTSACAIHGTVNLHDTGHVLPPLGLNDGFHAPLAPATVTRYCGHTIRTPQLSAEGLTAYYDSIAICPSMKTIVLVEGPDVALVVALVQLLHAGDAIELGNELELPPHNLTVAQYAAFIAAARAAVPNVNLITGGVFTLNADTKPYLLAASAACADCTLGVHLYEALSDADVKWLNDLGRPLAVTEFGAHANCDGGAGQRAWIENQWAAFARVPAIMLAVVYQRAVGPSCSDADTFGIAGLPAEGLF